MKLSKIYSNPITTTLMLSATTIQIPVTIISSAKKYLGAAKDFVVNSIPAAQLFLFAAIGYYVFSSTKISYENIEAAINDMTHQKNEADVNNIANQTEEAINDMDNEANINNATNSSQSKTSNTSDNNSYKRTIEESFRLNSNAQILLSKQNAEGLNLAHQAALKANFFALRVIVRGLHNNYGNTLKDIWKHPITNFANSLLHFTGLDKLPLVGDRTMYTGLTAAQINQQISVEGEHKGKTVTHLAASTFRNKQDLKELEEMYARGADPSIEDQNGKTATDLAFENTQHEVSPAQIIETFTNHGKHFAKPLNRAIDQDNTRQTDAHFENAESKNWTIFGLNIGPNNAKKLLTQEDQDGTQPLDHAIKKGNLPVIGRLQDNKVFAKNEQAVEVSKLVDANINKENIKLETELLKNTNDVKTVEKIKDAVTTPELTTLCDQRTDAIGSVYNQDFLTQVANQVVATYLPTPQATGTLGGLSNFVQNPTVSTSQKAVAVLTSLPNAQTMVNEAIIEKAVSTTSKVIGWAGDFLAAVGEELGKGIAQESITDSFSANAAQDYAAAYAYTPKVNIGSPISTWMIQDFSQPLAIAGAENNDFGNNLFLEYATKA